VIVGRLIPAGTGAVMGGLREVATGRDQLILDEREKEQAVKSPERHALPAGELAVQAAGEEAAQERQLQPASRR
jgi:DNA-directed RNA polymerase subunit beta'